MSLKTFLVKASLQTAMFQESANVIDPTEAGKLLTQVDELLEQLNILWSSLQQRT